MAIRRLLIFAPIAAGLALAALAIGRAGTEVAEQRIRARGEAALAAVGVRWARLEADGTRLRLAGAAPDPFAQELAEETLRRALPLAVIENRSTAAALPPPPPRPTRVDLVRDGARLVLTGILPDPQTRARLHAALAAAAPTLAVADLTETGGEGALPPAAAGLAARALAQMSPARLVLEPGLLGGQGLAASETARGALLAALLEGAGAEIALDLEIRVPPPVIEPFSVAASLAPGGALRLETCAARSPEEAAALVSLLRRHGLREGPADCQAGLGGPPGDWVGALAAGLAALDGAARGRLALTDRELRLDLPDPLSEAEADRLRAQVEAALPPGYVARLALATAETGPQAEPEAPPPRPFWLALSQGPDGVVLAGQVPQGDAAAALDALARAQFPGRLVQAALTERTDPAPEGWLQTALAAVEALAALDSGEARLTPGRLALEGRIAEAAAAGRLHRGLAARLPGVEIGTALTVDLPARVAAFPPDPARCAVLLNRMMEADPVQFAPGSAVIEPSARPVLAQAAALLRRCDEARIEIGGHTDSQGSAELNERLSRARAEAVRDALLGLGVSLARLTARGYGESQPVADNATEEGRARNRRIEFRVVGSDEP